MRLILLHGRVLGGGYVLVHVLEGYVLVFLVVVVVVVRVGVEVGGIGHSIAVLELVIVLEDRVGGLLGLVGHRRLLHMSDKRGEGLRGKCLRFSDVLVGHLEGLLVDLLGMVRQLDHVGVPVELTLVDGGLLGLLLGLDCSLLGFDGLALSRLFFHLSLLFHLFLLLELSV